MKDLFRDQGVGLLAVWLLAGFCSAASAQDVLMLPDDPLDSENLALKALLEGEGYTVTMGPAYTTYDGTNPSTAGFDSVVHLAGSTFDFDMPTAGQDELVSFVNGGGGFVTSEWTAYGVNEGYYQNMGDLVLVMRVDVDQLDITVGSYTPAVGMAGHEFNSYLTLPFSFSGERKLVNLQKTFVVNPSEVPVVTDTGRPGVVVRDVGSGRAAHINLVAPSWHVNTWHDEHDPDFDTFLIASVAYVTTPSSGSVEICDGIDNDLDGIIDNPDQLQYYSFYTDGDNDGFAGDSPGFVIACSVPAGYTDELGDCDDSEPLAFPGAPEVVDLIDNDCDGDIDEGFFCNPFVVRNDVVYEVDTSGPVASLNPLPGPFAANTTALASEPSTGRLFTMADDGTVYMYSNTGVPAGSFNPMSGGVPYAGGGRHFTGTFNSSGQYVVLAPDQLSFLLIDPVSMGYTRIFTSEVVRVADFSFDASAGMLVGFDHVRQELVNVDLSTGNLTVRPTTGALPSGTVGSTWIDLTGHLRLYENSGRIYDVDLALNSSSYWSPAPKNHGSDGASCVPAQVACTAYLADGGNAELYRFDSADLSVTSVGTGGTLYGALAMDPSGALMAMSTNDEVLVVSEIDGSTSNLGIPVHESTGVALSTTGLKTGAIDGGLFVARGDSTTELVVIDLAALTYRIQPLSEAVLSADMAFDPDGVLWVFDHLQGLPGQVDVATGAVVWVPATGAVPSFWAAGMWFEGRVLYMNQGNGELFSFDTTSGVGVFEGMSSALGAHDGTFCR